MASGYSFSGTTWLLMRLDVKSASTNKTNRIRRLVD